MNAHLTIPADDGQTIAYRARSGNPSQPGVVWLGGFASDMTGSKATAIDTWAEQSGHACVRFDYFGHGASSGDFVDGTIGRWRDDALAVIDRLTDGPQVLVGSSMGGWIALLAALARPDRAAGLMLIAPAPDFTEDLMWDAFTPEMRAELTASGIIEQPSDYDDGPYRISLKLIEDGRRHLLLRGPIAVSCPVRIIHGMQDLDVPWQRSLTLVDRLAGGDVLLTLVKDGDHRLSDPVNLTRITGLLGDLCAVARPENRH